MEKTKFENSAGIRQTKRLEIDRLLDRLDCQTDKQTDRQSYKQIILGVENNYRFEP